MACVLPVWIMYSICVCIYLYKSTSFPALLKGGLVYIINFGNGVRATELLWGVSFKINDFWLDLDISPSNYTFFSIGTFLCILVDQLDPICCWSVLGLKLDPMANTNGDSSSGSMFTATWFYVYVQW